MVEIPRSWEFADLTFVAKSSKQWEEGKPFYVDLIDTQLIHSSNHKMRVEKQLKPNTSVA